MTREWTSRVYYQIVFALVILSLGLVGCESSEQKSLKQGRLLLNKGEVDAAADIFEKLIQQTSDVSVMSASAEFLAEILIRHKKKYKESLRYLDICISNSTQASVSRSALQKKVFILFHHLALYPEAVKLYIRLLSMDGLSPQEQDEYRLNLSKSYFFISQFEQARIESERILKESKIAANKDRAAKIISESYLSENLEPSRAIEKYKTVMSYVQSADTKKDMIFNLALWLEQKNKYKEAYDILAELSLKNDELISAKMKQLQQLYILQTRRPR